MCARLRSAWAHNLFLVLVSIFRARGDGPATWLVRSRVMEPVRMLNGGAPYQHRSQALGILRLSVFSACAPNTRDANLDLCSPLVDFGGMGVLPSLGFVLRSGYARHQCGPLQYVGRFWRHGRFAFARLRSRAAFGRLPIKPPKRLAAFGAALQPQTLAALGCLPPASLLGILRYRSEYARPQRGPLRHVGGFWRHGRFAFARLRSRAAFGRLPPRPLPRL